MDLFIETALSIVLLKLSYLMAVTDCTTSIVSVACHCSRCGISCTCCLLTNPGGGSQLALTACCMVAQAVLVKGRIRLLLVALSVTSRQSLSCTSCALPVTSAYHLRCGASDDSAA
jgi:hypothetical protein